jgi:mono/diheme cytochrome c family protein
MRKPLAVAVVGVAATLAAGAQQLTEWKAPEAVRAVKNPLALTDALLARGLQLFQKNCLVCHGETGKGDGPAAEFIKGTKPADITDVKKQEKWTDGELFWKITNGRKPMPPFGRRLSEKERWALVHYARSLKGK